MLRAGGAALLPGRLRHQPRRGLQRPRRLRAGGRGPHPGQRGGAPTHTHTLHHPHLPNTHTPTHTHTHTHPHPPAPTRTRPHPRSSTCTSGARASCATSRCALSASSARGTSGTASRRGGRPACTQRAPYVHPRAPARPRLSGGGGLLEKMRGDARRLTRGRPPTHCSPPPLGRCGTTRRWRRSWPTTWTCATSSGLRRAST